MTKDVFMEMRIQESLVEAEGFDLIVMGRPEGPGMLLRSQYLAFASSLKNYRKIILTMVVDNEAGMEHISRLTTRHINVLLIVSDSSRRGIQAAVRIGDLTRELGLKMLTNTSLSIRPKKRKTGNERNGKIYLKKHDLVFLGVVPQR